MLAPGLVPSLAQDASPSRHAPYQFRETALRQIPDYDVLSLAFPPNLWLLSIEPRNAYLAKISQDPLPLQHLRLLLGLGEYIHETSTENLHAYFDSPPGALAPDVLIALNAAGFSNRARVMTAAIAAFGPDYPVENRKRADFFSKSFLRIQEGIVPDLSKPPTALEIELQELGKQFLGKVQFRADVEAYAARDPVIAAALQQAREQLPDDQRLSFLQDRLLPGPSGFGAAAVIQQQIEQMPPSYRTVYVLTLLVGELFNGGMHQFFSNSSGAFAPYAAKALRDVGKDDAATTVDQAIGLFPTPYPISTEERRRVAFAHDWNAWDDKLDALTNAIDGEDIQKALTVYARQQDILPR